MFDRLKPSKGRGDGSGRPAVGPDVPLRVLLIASVIYWIIAPIFIVVPTALFANCGAGLSDRACAVKMSFIDLPLLALALAGYAAMLWKVRRMRAFDRRTYEQPYFLATAGYWFVALLILSLTAENTSLFWEVLPITILGFSALLFWLPRRQARLSNRDPSPSVFEGAAGGLASKPASIGGYILATVLYVWIGMPAAFFSAVLHGDCGLGPVETRGACVQGTTRMGMVGLAVFILEYCVLIHQTRRRGKSART